MNLALTSLRGRMLALILPPVAIAILGLTFFAISRATTQEREAVDRDMAAVASGYASDVDGLAREKLGAASTLAGVLEGSRGTSRQPAESIVRRVLEHHPDALGAWATFEPDAWDGADALNRGVGPSDKNGVFAPYAYRADGKV